VLVDGEEKPACDLEIAAVEGRAVVTSEGLGTLERPHPLQAAFLELQAGQCGYCLSGILVGAKALLDRNPDPSREEIASALSWHLCRCGVHNRVMDAVALAAKRLREGAPA
jgi:nicotinate dehydrogenase subunit A